MEAGLVLGPDVPPEYEALVAPHVASFDFFLGEGMELVMESLQPVEIVHPLTRVTHRFWFEDARVGRPVKEDAAPNADPRLFPVECREAGITYKGPFSARLVWDSSNGLQGSLTKKLGSMPIMTRSSACHLHGMNRQQLVQAKEEANEMGGYFICNGIERIIRCLIMQRRHYVMALRRGAYHKRGANYTDAATLVRCVRPDQTSATVRCHYLKDGTVNFAFTMRKAEYFIPAGVLLKCFLEVSDRELYAKIMSGAPPDGGHAAFVAERAELLLSSAARFGLKTKAQCLEHLGSHFRVVLDSPPSMSDYEAGQQLLREYVFIHLNHAADKMQLLMLMLHKLYALVNSACCEDNPDALTHHELMLPGHLLLKFLKERLEDTLAGFKELVKKDLEKSPESVNLTDEAYIKKMADKMPDIGRKFEYLLNTGNLISKSGLDMSQVSGYTVVAEKLNFFRYLSHFRSVHRGAYFAELRTTTVRKLLPESWGFLCPVHTPDGSPCGLLNHFTAACRIVTHGPEDQEELHTELTQVLTGLGMLPSAPALVPPTPPDYLTVMVDGKVVGSVRASQAPAVVDRLRCLKAAALALESEHPEGEAIAPEEMQAGEDKVPSHMEITYIPYLAGGTYPGLYLFTQSARMMRPVRQLRTGALELIGTLEQNNMNIKCPDGGAGGSPGLAFTHSELSAGAMLSLVASMTPYSDYNQSPRNMYQCQMGKQTMGTPTQALQHRTDGKLYRLQTPQTPIARTEKYNQYHMDEYPNGTNAVVAVLAYTGYDMEDAMILNKSSMERGLCHGSLYKNEMIDLREEKGTKSVFKAEPHDERSRKEERKMPVGAFGQRFPQNLMTKAGSQSTLPPPRGAAGAAGPGPASEAAAAAAAGAKLGKDGKEKKKRSKKSLAGGEAEAMQVDGAEGEAAAAAAAAADGSGAAGVQPEGGWGVMAEYEHKHADHLGPDGLPHVGAIIWPGQPVYSTQDLQTGQYKAHKLKGEEVAHVEAVTMVGTKEKGNAAGMLAQRANIRMRFNRNPTIGDKFASRAGQKGVLSILWPDVDMPYCASTGIRPDLIINPHAFPSRMTIGMLVESMGAKAGAMRGEFVDATPFQRCDGKPGEPVEYFGKQLEQAGFAKYGQETMISGITGQEMPCDIYIGIVYYQRLRHMVSDKFQVRSMGPINQLTKQPVKGRKLGGGIRFGEMERDSLLAHGAAYLLHDRLHACSDYHVLDACSKCGSIIAPLNKPPTASDAVASLMGPQADISRQGRVVCPVCQGSSRSIERVAMPYVFKYLATELAAMNIKVMVEVN